MKRGDLWIHEDPFVHVLSQNERDLRCDFCFRRPEEGHQIPRCSSCKVVRFCNRTCQSSSWMVHKKECRSLKRVAPKIPTDSVRLFFRLLIKLQSEPQVVEVFGKKRSWSDLESHVDEIQEDQVRLQHFMQLITTLRTFSEDIVSLPSVEELFVIFGKVCVNSFSICDSEMNPIGVGVYLRCSVLDHSCTPNAVAVFEGTKLHIRCVEPVSCVQDLRISYIDTLDDTATRRNSLKKQYYFNCICQECKDSTKDQIKLSYKCMNKECNGHVISQQDDTFSCDCCCQVTEDVFDLNFALEKTQKMLKELEKLKNSKEYDEIQEKGFSFLNEVQAVLHSDNVYLIKLFDILLDVCIESAHWNEALHCGMATLAPYKFHYGDYHPSLGILLFKIGKMLSHIEDGRALLHLQQAATVLALTHGEQHSLYKELAQFIQFHFKT